MKSINPLITVKNSLHLYYFQNVFKCDANILEKNVSEFCQLSQTSDERGEGGEGVPDDATREGEEQETFHSGGGGQYWLGEVHLP